MVRDEDGKWKKLKEGKRVYAADAVALQEGTVVFEVPLASLDKIMVNRIKKFELSHGQEHAENREARIKNLIESAKKGGDLMNTDLANAKQMTASLTVGSSNKRSMTMPSIGGGLAGLLAAKGITKGVHERSESVPILNKRLHAEHLIRVERSLTSDMSIRAERKRGEQFQATRDTRLKLKGRLKPAKELALARDKMRIRTPPEDSRSQIIMREKLEDDRRRISMAVIYLCQCLLERAFIPYPDP